MQRMAARHQVTYIARCQTLDAANPETIAYFRDHHIEPILVGAPLPKKKGSLFMWPGGQCDLSMALFGHQSPKHGHAPSGQRLRG